MSLKGVLSIHRLKPDAKIKPKTLTKHNHENNIEISTDIL